MRAREENGARRTTATESGGKAESGRGGRGGQGGAAAGYDNLTSGDATPLHNCNAGFPSGDGTCPTSAPVTPVGGDLGEEGKDQGGHVARLQPGTRGGGLAAAPSGRQRAAEGEVGVEVDDAVAVGICTLGRATPAAARNGRQDAVGGAASMEVEEPDGDAGDDAMQLD